MKTCRGYLLEALQQGASKDNLQYMFLRKNKKTISKIFGWKKKKPWLELRVHTRYALSKKQKKKKKDK